MLNAQQLATMLSLQDKMNAKVNPDWLNAGYGYLRAAMVESVEAIEHHGWKWWKAQHKDLPQLQMELVDIWHFALSACIIDANGDVDASAKSIAAELASGQTVVVFDNQNYDATQQSLLDNLELMTGLCAAKRFSVPLFMHIVKQCDMSVDELYRQYVGKNVLNFFRQDNGYKEGTYVKQWSGREDNEHLVEVMNALDLSKPEFSDLVYQGLQARYQSK
ncbi:dUTP diphosphatase [Alteromonas genovensis]|jgi:dimeric dUTPase (all-alpha-NTP-PPase superfamily)|uniref:dUTP diphosphatase n=1 Tax=Alteromonas genovensis TaxID=471225 RepID=A0A6N9TIR4_9ALTE|nr:dUTP diphosphatase [Alteromonas genovensis]NDW15985.1 dUTP diphosphatase [Alteromonas genovensis]